MNKLLNAAAVAAVLVVPASIMGAATAEPAGDTTGQAVINRLVWQAVGDNAILSPAPSPAVPATTTDAGKPGDIIDLSQWYLTLPTGQAGSPDTVKQPALADYSSQYMRLNDNRDGVVFTAHAGGTTTKNSKYPRSELREMQNGELAAWDGAKGTHSMEIRQAVTKLPTAKPEVVVGQIHGTSDDLMQIHLSGSKLTVKYDDGGKTVSLDDDYQLGRVFTVRIESAGGRVKVWYEGAQKADLPISSSTSYFKAGNYLQTNTDRGDDASASAEVVIYALTVRHAL